MASIHRYTTSKGEVRHAVHWRDGAGKQRSKAFSRRKDAERFRVEQDRARQLGRLYEAPRERFGDFLVGWLARHERRVHEAVLRIEPPRHETRDPRFLTWAEVEELASYCCEHRLIVVAALSGLRRGELFALTASRVDLEGAAITVAVTGDGGKVGRPKGGKVRRVHVERRVVELLAEQ